jgi:hypothetical protein
MSQQNAEPGRAERPNTGDRTKTDEGAMHATRRRVEQVVEHNPGSSILISFGVGLGLGLIATTLLARPEEESWLEMTQRKARESWRHSRDSIHWAEEQARHVPDAFHHLSETIRGLPEALARHLPSTRGRA